MFLKGDVREKTADASVARGALANIGGKRIVRYITPRILLLLCGYFAGSAALWFGARPFGTALLASASGGSALFLFAGLAISAFLELELGEAALYFGVYTATLMFRALMNLAKKPRNEPLSFGWLLKNAFSEKLGARVLVSASFSILLGAITLFARGMLYYDLFGLLLSAVISPILTALAYGFFERPRSVWRDVGFFALACVAVLGAGDLAVYGVSVAVAGALIAVFYSSYVRGAGFGIALSLALGLCYSFVLSPIFVIAAICAAVFIRFSPALACFCTFAAASAWAFFAVGLSALLGVFGGILTACLAYTAAHKIIFVDLADKADEKERAEGAVTGKKESASRGAEKPECRVLFESELDGIKLSDMNLKMSAVGNALKKVSSVSGEAKTDGDICGEKYNYECFPNDVSANFDAISDLLTKTAEQSENNYKIDEELSKKLSFILADMNLYIFGVAVFGVRKKTIYIKGKRREILEENVQNIIDSIEPILPFSLRPDGYEIRREGDGERGALFLYEKEKLSVSIVRRSVIAKDEIVCGDSASVFKNGEGRFFGVISDGMGSGSRASAVAQTCTGFVSNLLSVGGANLELVSALNGVVCGRRVGGEIERTATLDLFELDLMNGEAQIYKCGAAPSYIYRKGRLFKVRSQTMPLGILREPDVKTFSFTLCRGDVVVMVSDGVTGEEGECPWLFDLLTKNLPCRTLESTAELIVKYSIAKGSGDDVSLLLVKIK